MKSASYYMSRPAKLPKQALGKLKHYWRQNPWHKLVTILVCLLLILLTLMYGTARWYQWSERNKPLQLGVSFIPAYAQSLGVDPEKTMDALLDMGVKHFRLVSYWNQGEPSPGHYDFTLLDWQFKKAEAHHAKITLTLGLRQPRWPECHPPAWTQNQPREQWQPELMDYIKTVMQRYKNSPALEDYQLENEYFLKGFGLCTDYSRDRLIAEYNLVKQIDPKHPVIIGRSNNAIGFPIGQPQPDRFSISVYQRVWDATLTHRYLEYPFPAWYYSFLAGVQKIFNHRDMSIGELQGEAWAPNLKTIKDISLDEQNKSLNPARLDDRIKFGEATGMKQIYLWGAEYWYYRKEVLHDPSVWNVVKEHFQNDRSH